MVYQTGAQNIFVALRTSSGAPSVSTIAAPAGYGYSAAAPVSGTTWNAVGRSATVASGTGVGSYVLYAGLALKNSTNASIIPTLSVSYVVPSGTTLTTEPASGSGENALQPGGVMENAWRNYDNSAGKYFVFTISNLPPSTPFGLYFYGGTTTSGQSVSLTLLPSSAFGGSTTNGSTSNTTANSNGSFGSLWTVSGGTTNLMPQGTTWNVLYGQSSALGVFSFLFTGPASYAYFNGFQIVPLSLPGISGVTNQTIIAGDNATLTAVLTGLPAAALQWFSNNVALASQTNSSLTLDNVQYAQNGAVYSLAASNLAGVVTNNMTLTVIVTPSIAGLNNEAVPVGSTVSIPAAVSGAPVPALQWEFNGTNLSDGATGRGSIISGSTRATLFVTNAQAADSGTYSLVASNSAGVATNSMSLTVSSGNVPPNIAGPANQTAVQGSNVAFSANVTGLPEPMLQWLQNGMTLAGQTNATLVLTDVQLGQSGDVYSLIATNISGAATNSATLTILVPPAISMQPTNLAATNGFSASFSVSASGVPTPAYQWYFASNAIPFATGPAYTIPSVSAANMGSYYVILTNSVGSVTSSAATLTVDSAMSVVSLTPSNGAVNICHDTPLYITFSSPPVLATPGTGKIRIYNVTNSTTPVDTLDMSQNVTLETPFAVNAQQRTIAGETFYSFPVIITSNTAAIYPHLDLLNSNQTYYVTVDTTVFTDTNGAYFTGIAGTNTWRFTTKPTGPANPTNIVVAQDNSGDFATVQGAIDSVPANNTAPTAINIHNGTYTEIVEAHSKNNLTFLGQSRSGTVIAYANNGNLNANTHTEIVFKINANDIAVENLTLDDTSGYGASPAEALMIETGAKRSILNNVNIDSYQDTILVNTSDSTAYFCNSLIEGSVDYIWGGGDCFFTNCQLNTLTSGGNILQLRTSAGSNGMSFVDCALTGSNGFSGCTLGRAIGIPNGNGAYIHCQITNIFSGWDPQDATNTSLDNRWWEFGNSNLPPTAPAVYNGTQLTANSLTLSNALSAVLWLNGWQPQLAPAIFNQPASQSIAPGQILSLSVGAIGIPDSYYYQWQLNGINIPGATNASFTIPNVYPPNAGNYSVIVSNSTGRVVSSNATVAISAISPVPLPQYNYDNVIDVTHYGAIGDGVTTNTTAIQNAINAAAVGGVTNGLRGGTVEIPPGNYLCGPITLSNYINLQIDSGAMLQMLPMGSYPGGTTNPPDFIFGQSLHDIAITGPGTIDGNGAGWQSAILTNSSIVRPRAMFAPQTCSNVLVQDITLQNPPNTHISLRFTCVNVTVNNININTPGGTENTDGIDLGADNIIIANSHISDGDDFIAMDGCAGVTITNCLFGTGHGVSIGSYTTEGVSNLLVINCVWTNGTSGIHLKSDDGRGGLAQNLNYINLAMTNTQIPIFFYSYYTNNGTSTGVGVEQAATYPALPVTSLTPIWRNIYISNVTAVAASGFPAGIIWGKPEMSFSNVVMDHVNITASGYFELYNAQGVQLIDSTITVPSTNAMALYNAGLTITNRAPATNAVRLEGVSANGHVNALSLYNANAALSATNMLANNHGIALGDATLTVGNNLSLSSSDDYSFELGSNASTVAVDGNLGLDGTNDIIAGAGFTNGLYPLFTYTGNLSGSLPTLGSAPAGYHYAIDTSEEGEVNLIVTSPPGIPADLTAEGTNLTVNLQWLASANAGSYNVKRSTTNGGPYTTIANMIATHYSDTAVNPGTVYYYVVSATNAAGESANSIQASAVPLPTRVSTNLSFQMNGNQLQLSWPADHLGWQLQIQTNAPGGGIGTNWVDWPGSTNVIQTNISVNPAYGSVFLRLIYP